MTTGATSHNLKGTTKKTRTSSNSQAFNTQYGSTGVNNNFTSSKYISHQPMPSAATASLVAPSANQAPIVMVMHPSKQTQIQNILMNFYQNTNSRANHHNYDHRVYPTKVSQGGPSSTSNKQASIVGTKPNGTKQHIMVSTDGGLKLSAAPAS